MNQKGFSLVTVLVLSLVIFLIGSTGLYIATTGVKMTKADMNLNLAEKAANAGLMDALDRINQAGTGGTTSEITGNIGVPTYKTLIEFGGRNLWFLSSEGKDRPSNNSSSVVKTALFQGFYGAGLYTVRGNVNATLGGARLSGCDVVDATDPNDDCLVPAFVAAGTVNATVPQNDCSTNSATNGTSTGLYGNPAIVNMDQGDLSRMFFRVQCFNKFGNTRCNTSLLDYFENDYGFADPAHTQQDMSFQQPVYGPGGVVLIPGNGWGIPVVTIAAPTWTIPTPPALPNICIYNTGGNINLATQMTTCDEIRIDSAAAVSGNGLRSGVAVKIYSNTTNAITINNASNFEFYTANRSSVSNSNNFSIDSTYIGTSATPNTITSCNDFDLNVSGFTTLNTSNRFFRLYTTGVTTLNNTIGVTDPNPSFRIVSTNNINVGANATLTNGTLISGPVQVSATNSVSSPQNLVAAGNITISDVNLFVRSLRFNGTNPLVYILDSLVYVYAFACPSCPDNTSTSSLAACDGNSNWCGWFGNGVNLNVGCSGTCNNASDARPTLFISNNTAVRTDNTASTINTWGVWYGERVTYLRFNNASGGWNMSGFMIRNFPSNLTLNISLTASNYILNFSRQNIDAITNRYRFFRRVQCIREPLTPRAQLIQTRMTNY